MARTQITGYLYDAQGATIVTGQLSLTLLQDIVQDGIKVAPVTVAIDLSAQAPPGRIDVSVYPTQNASPAGVSYLVEFDPTPSDTSSPARTKNGYWSNYWSVPQVASVALGNFVSALRGEPSSNYMPVGASLSQVAETMLLGSTVADNTKTISANQVGANKPSIRYYHVTGKWQVCNDGVTWFDVGSLETALATSTVYGGDVTGLYNALQIAPGAVGTTELATVATLTPGAYGTATQVPQLTVDAKGRVSGVTPVTIAGVAPGGAASGDLGGSYPAPSVIKIQGKAVAATVPLTGQILRWNASGFWEPSNETSVGAGGSGVTGLTDANIASNAAIAWSKISKTGALLSHLGGTLAWASVSKSGSSLSDLGARSAGDLTSGTLPLARLSGITVAQCASANVSQWTNDAGYSSKTLRGSDLGGARSRGVKTAGFVDVEEWRDWVAETSIAVTIYVDVKTDDASTSVTARVYDVTSSSSPSGATSTSSVTVWWVEKTLTFSVIAGHRYRLQVSGSNASNAVRAIGVR